MPVFDMNTLQHYMFTRKHIMNLLDDAAPNSDKKKKILPKTPKNLPKIIDEDFILPTQTDTLFWCFYIICCGLFKFETLGSSTFKEEKVMKIELVEILRSFKDLMKKNKWKRSVIENELVVEKKISLTTLFCICAIKKINLVVVKNRCVYVQENITGMPFELIVFGEHGFMISQHSEVKKKHLINEYITDYWLIDDITKPLRAISNYKVGNLREICSKLKIPIVTEKGKKYNKKELYHMITCKI